MKKSIKKNKSTKKLTKKREVSSKKKISKKQKKITSLKHYKERYYFEATIYDNSKKSKQSKFTITKITKKGIVKYGVTRNGYRFHKFITVVKSKKEFEKLFEKYKKKKTDKLVITLRTGKVIGRWNKRKNIFSVGHAKFRIQNIGKRRQYKVGVKRFMQWTDAKDVIDIIDNDFEDMIDMSFDLSESELYERNKDKL